MKRSVIMFACLLVGTWALASAQDASQQSAPDNTKVNQRDKDRTEPTADQQKESKSDRDIAQQIRQSIVKDKSLSTYAHNIKVISQSGTVTLKGPVKSAEEKNAIEAKAAGIVGQDKIINQLEVKPDKD
jgi:hyperosmotically inducible protein